MILRRKKFDEKYYGDIDSGDEASFSPTKKSPLQKLKLLTYGPISLGFGVMALILLVLCLCFSIISSGTSGMFIGILGLAALVLSFIGLIVALYGHFIVKIEGKVHWLWALIPNAIIFALFLVLYIVGLTTKSPLR